MVSWSEGDLYIEGGHDVLVEISYKSIPVVRDGQIWTAIPASPFQKGPAALSRGWLAKRVALYPTASPIQDAEEIAVALRLR